MRLVDKAPAFSSRVKIRRALSELLHKDGTNSAVIAVYEDAYLSLYLAGRQHFRQARPAQRHAQNTGED
ncbi:hypothetical protein SAMN02746095_03429 [Acidocella aminolytica 101 = DSM 11237]|nr:hypothetical protein SAMN02746095_03429 [Acidocella aminolytica 101 = DSM 11237]